MTSVGASSRDQAILILLHHHPTVPFLQPNSLLLGQPHKILDNACPERCPTNQRPTRKRPVEQITAPLSII